MRTSWAVEIGNQVQNALMAYCPCTKLSQPQTPRFALFGLAQPLLKKANMPCFSANLMMGSEAGHSAFVLID